MQITPHPFCPYSCYAKWKMLETYPCHLTNFLFLYFRCNLRFPSTNIRLFFQSLIDDPDLEEDVTEDSLHGGKNNSHGISDMKPLNISIPQQGSNNSANAAQLKLIPNYHNHSPPSPTGTIKDKQVLTSLTCHLL